MRRTELDLCRILGCLMVLVIHAGAEVYQQCRVASLDFAVVNLISTAVRPGVPIFFMLTGALVLTRENMDVKKLFKNHVLFLTGIFFLWSFIYAFLGSLVSGGFGSVYDFAYTVISGHYHMWFLPAMIICYVFMPPAHALIHGKSLDKRYLPLMFLLLVLVPANMNLTPDTSPMLYRITFNFSISWITYMGYVIWGWWLATRKLPKNTLWLAPLVCILCLLLTTVANHWYSFYKGEPDGWLFDYFSLPNFIQASAIFCFFLSLKDRNIKGRKIIGLLADCTLGVYLIHPLMINVFEVLGLGISVEAPVSGLLRLCTLLALSCFALVFVAKRIPFVRKLI